MTDEVLDRPTHRRRTDAPWWARALVGLGIVAGLAVMVGAVLSSNDRSERLVHALCEMADAFRDDELQDRAVVQELRRQGDRYAAGITVLLADEATQDQALADLRLLLERQARAAEEAAERPPLPANVAELCPGP